MDSISKGIQNLPPSSAEKAAPSSRASEEPSLPGDSVTISGAASRGKTRRTQSVKAEKALEGPKAAESKGTPVVFADCIGQITHLGIQVDGGVASDGNMGREVFNTIKTLFRELEGDTKFTIVCDRDTDVKRIQSMMKEINLKDPERVSLLRAPYDITSWMRDNMVMEGVPDKPGKAIMIDKVPFQSHDHPNLPKWIADNTPDVIYVKDNHLRTDGGDVVSDEHKAYVGYDSIYLTAMNLYKKSPLGITTFSAAGLEKSPPVFESSHFSKKIVFDEVPAHSHLPRFHLEDNPEYKPIRTLMGQDPERASISQAVRYFEGKYSKEVVVVGDDDPSTPAKEKPATFHIDMGVTPVDNTTVLLGSPTMAMNMIRSWSPDKYAQANASLQRETGLKGDILGDIMAHNSVADPKDPSVMMIQNNFDSQERKLRKAGKNIVKLPYLEGDNRKRTPWITYGNCIMQNFTAKDGRHVKNVFLPVYGIPLDDVAKETYMAQGFKVVPLTLAAFTSLAGAIRCMSNYLGRSEAV
ncbi:MAG: hypothetical protein RDV48_30610 [Candidatus Eremiobacteraeota bacterium]|nr:hypothetical protein [Candidatus Eremiobacteraeota bacterium]